MCRRSHRGSAAFPKAGGFTLVELLVVIGVLMVLVALLLPTLGLAREKAIQANCLSNLRQIGAAFALYEAENRRLPALPYEAGDWATFPATITGPAFDARVILKPYLDVDYFVCPGVSPWRPSEATTPVVDVDYFLTPGYYGDAAVADLSNPNSAMFLGSFYTRSSRPWCYGPYRMSVWAGDRLYLDPVTLPGTWRHIVNHPGRQDGYAEWSPPGFTGKAWLGKFPAGEDRRSRLRGNFLFSDGSAQNLGNEATMIQVPSRHALRLGANYLMPAGR